MRLRDNFRFFFAICLFIYSSCRSSPHSPVHILCLGDSLTASSYGSYPFHLKRELRKYAWVQVSEAARPGNTSGEYLHFLQESHLLEKEKPDIVLLMLGTNDIRIDSDFTPPGRFRSNMQKILDLIRSRRPGEKPGKTDMILATVPPILTIDLPVFNEGSRLRVSREINPAIRGLAKQYQLPVVELEGFFLEHPGLLPGIHPNEKGYRGMAREFFSVIRQRLK